MTRPEVKHLRRMIGLGLIAMIAVLAAMMLAPHDRYIRWQALKTEAYARLGWTYERVHFDQTPIDVAFIGTSHTMNGVDGAAVARRLGALGAAVDGGRCPTVTNFAIPSYGRNLHWVLARELLENRPVKVLVLEVFENETRKAHPAFSHVANESDIVGAPAIINLNYFHDMVRLPYRQAQLAFESAFPSQFALKTHFDPSNYDGSTVDNTRVVNADGIALTPPRTKVTPAAELDAAAKANRDNKKLNMLGRRFEAVEYAYPRYYLDRILDLAKAKGVKVVFMYLPGYGQPPAPYDLRPYAGRGPIIAFNDLLSNKGYWEDVNHLNAEGAAAVSARLGGLLAPTLPGGGAPDRVCDYGYAPRAVLKPFEKP
jgi:hypothetical protein